MRVEQQVELGLVEVVLVLDRGRRGDAVGADAAGPAVVMAEQFQYAATDL